jgi:hypothetical protein
LNRFRPNVTRFVHFFVEKILSRPERWSEGKSESFVVYSQSTQRIGKARCSLSGPDDPSMAFYIRPTKQFWLDHIGCAVPVGIPILCTNPILAHLIAFTLFGTVLLTFRHISVLKKRSGKLWHHRTQFENSPSALKFRKLQIRFFCLTILLFYALYSMVLWWTTNSACNSFSLSNANTCLTALKSTASPVWFFYSSGHLLISFVLGVLLCWSLHLKLRQPILALKLWYDDQNDVVRRMIFHSTRTTGDNRLVFQSMSWRSQLDLSGFFQQLGMAQTFFNSASLNGRFAQGSFPDKWAVYLGTPVLLPYGSMIVFPFFFKLAQLPQPPLLTHLNIVVAPEMASYLMNSSILIGLCAPIWALVAYSYFRVRMMPVIRSISASDADLNAGPSITNVGRERIALFQQLRNRFATKEFWVVELIVLALAPIYFDYLGLFK